MGFVRPEVIQEQVHGKNWWVGLGKGYMRFNLEPSMPSLEKPLPKWVKEAFKFRLSFDKQQWIGT